jgi:hypothetical protein
MYSTKKSSQRGSHLSIESPGGKYQKWGIFHLWICFCQTKMGTKQAGVHLGQVVSCQQSRLTHIFFFFFARDQHSIAIIYLVEIIYDK